jgi:hypothetical protein
MLKFETIKKPTDFMEQIAERHRVLRKRVGYSQS